MFSYIFMIFYICLYICIYIIDESYGSLFEFQLITVSWVSNSDSGTGDRYNACNREARCFQRWSSCPPSSWSSCPPSSYCQTFPAISNPNVPAYTNSLMPFGKFLISELGGPGGLIVQTASIARYFLISFEENWTMQIWHNCRQIWTTMQLPCGLWHHRGGDVYLQ